MTGEEERRKEELGNKKKRRKRRTMRRKKEAPEPRGGEEGKSKERGGDLVLCLLPPHRAPGHPRLGLPELRPTPGVHVELLLPALASHDGCPSDARECPSRTWPGLLPDILM